MSKVAREIRAEGAGTRNLWTQHEKLLLAECYIQISEDPNWALLSREVRKFNFVVNETKALSGKNDEDWLTMVEIVYKSVTGTEFEHKSACDVSVNSKPSVTELYAVNDEAFMVDKKYVNVTDLNLVSYEKVSISDRDDLEKKIDEVQVLDNVVCVDRNKNVYGSEAKTSAAVAFVVIKELYFNIIFDCWILNDVAFIVDKKYVNITDMIFSSDEKVSISDRDDLEKKFLIDFKDVYGSEAKTSAADYVVIKEDSYTSDETVQSKVTITEVLAVKDDAFMVDKKYVNASALNLSSDENVIISDRDVLEKEVDDVLDLENVVSDGNKCLVMFESGKIAFNGSHAKSVDETKSSYST
ncbi:hypothetical protein Tco_0600903 [Tanacetum coccineum]